MTDVPESPWSGRVNFVSALGLAQQLHAAAVLCPGSDVFSHFNLDRTAIGKELPSLAGTPAGAPQYSSVPTWNLWQDFCPAFQSS